MRVPNANAYDLRIGQIIKVACEYRGRSTGHTYDVEEITRDVLALGRLPDRALVDAIADRIDDEGHHESSASHDPYGLLELSQPPEP